MYATSLLFSCPLSCGVYVPSLQLFLCICYAGTYIILPLWYMWWEGWLKKDTMSLLRLSGYQDMDP